MRGVQGPCTALDMLASMHFAPLKGLKVDYVAPRFWFKKNAPQKYKQTKKNTEQDLVQNLFFEQSLLKITMC